MSMVKISLAHPYCYSGLFQTGKKIIITFFFFFFFFFTIFMKAIILKLELFQAEASVKDEKLLSMCDSFFVSNHWHTR